MTEFTALPDLPSGCWAGSRRDNDEFLRASDNLVDPQPLHVPAHSFGPKGQVYDVGRPAGDVTWSRGTRA